jgi:hypothetical protein
MAPGLLFKQVVRSAHRAVVDIKVHFERLHADGNWIEMLGLAATDGFLRADND